MGTALGGGGSGTPFNLGGSGTPPTFNPYWQAIFPLWREAPEKKFGPFKSTQNPFWGTFEWSNVKIFFGAPRQSCKKTLFILILGEGGQKWGFGHFWREAPKKKFIRQFWSEKLGFGIYGKEA